MNHRERKNCENKTKCETGREGVININTDVTGVLGKKGRERWGKRGRREEKRGGGEREK